MAHITDLGVSQGVVKMPCCGAYEGITFYTSAKGRTLSVELLTFAEWIMETHRARCARLWPGEDNLVTS